MASATRFGGSLMSPAASRRRQLGGLVRVGRWWRRQLSSGASGESAERIHRGRGNGGPILGRRVAEAVANGEPVVALESTLITHGLPEPENLEVALAMEREVSKVAMGETDAPFRAGSCPDKMGPNYAAKGVVPATVAIVRGQPLVGLSRDEIAYLANKQLSRPIKASRRDLAPAMARSLTAGTTVAGTMALLASLPGQPIRVFATGGLGGVHRGGEQSLDISADLHEMSRSPLGLVSSGFKSFLDAGRSLEYLETLGCTVMTLGSAQFPAFFRRHHSPPLQSPNSVATPEEAAWLLYWCLERSRLLEARAALLAVPIPAELADRFDESLEAEIAVEIDNRADLVGAQKTPLILERLSRATCGRSLEANIGLLRNNARVGAQVAHEYALLRSKSGAAPPRSRLLEPPATFTLAPATITTTTTTTASASLPPGEPKEPPGGALGEPAAYNEATKIGTIGRGGVGDGQVLVVGATMIDMHVATPMGDRFRSNPRHSGVTFEGRPHMALGGVGRNLARALHLLGRRPAFLTALARDNLGSFALDALRTDFAAADLRVSWWPGAPASAIATDGKKTPPASCFALVLIDSLTGLCEYVVANLEACRAIDAETLERNSGQIKRAPLVVADANLPAPSTARLLELCQAHQVPLFLEPTDVLALAGLVEALRAQPRQLLCLSPNQLELERMLHLLDHGDEEPNHDKDEELNAGSAEAISRRRLVERKARRLMSLYLPHLRCLLVTMDSGGCLVALRSGHRNASSLGESRLLEQFRADPSGAELATGKLQFRHFPVPRAVPRPVSASGAGDTFAAAFISGLLDNLTIEQCMGKAFEAALVALEEADTIPAKLAELRR